MTFHVVMRDWALGFFIGIELGHNILCHDGLDWSLGLLCPSLKMVTTLDVVKGSSSLGPWTWVNLVSLELFMTWNFVTRIWWALGSSSLHEPSHDVSFRDEALGRLWTFLQLGSIYGPWATFVKSQVGQDMICHEEVIVQNYLEFEGVCTCEACKSHEARELRVPKYAQCMTRGDFEFESS